MALDSGPLPVAIPTSVARTDFNNSMNQLNAAFPLQPINIANQIRLSTGKYTGNGVNPRSIEIGLLPSAIIVYMQFDDQIYFTKCTGDPAGSGLQQDKANHYYTENVLEFEDLGIKLLDHDAGYNPLNEDGKEYSYIACGQGKGWTRYYSKDKHLFAEGGDAWNALSISDNMEIVIDDKGFIIDIWDSVTKNLYDILGNVIGTREGPYTGE